MSYQVGNGGIIGNTYMKYGKLDNYISIKEVDQWYGHVASNVLYWNSSSGFHSIEYKTQNYATMQIDFREPFYLTGYRTLMLAGFRYTSDFLVKTSYKKSPYTNVHHNDVDICDSLKNGDCNATTERFVEISKQNIKKCDSIQFVSNGADTRKTYTLGFCAIEVYGYSLNCKTKFNHKSNFLFDHVHYIILFLIY